MILNVLNLILPLCSSLAVKCYKITNHKISFYMLDFIFLQTHVHVVSWADRSITDCCRSSRLSFTQLITFIALHKYVCSGYTWIHESLTLLQTYFLLPPLYLIMCDFGLRLGLLTWTLELDFGLGLGLGLWQLTMFQQLCAQHFTL